MIHLHLLLCLAISWLTYKTITRGLPNDPTAGAAGIMAGVLLGKIAGVSFIAGGWWGVIGYLIAAVALAAWVQVRRTVPVDIERDLAEYVAMKPELDELMEEIEMNRPKSVRLP